ncbi:uncharacterized protein LTR77_002212 [Saxophila tyrrhenica]|uniref:Zn(2)-C6 fungal-type domain-containing protein n=1 Tax=Saxophila tyrrhenica TaxID=1690608 RepID=A0AAV9PMJ3_9PEZI|nr:hypothetical protein LTR77_002212 [Saxophila tyrrhenica]
MAQRPRQDPVSCESCRKKKLKCSREVPCSNCAARSITCDYGVARPVEPRPSSKQDELSVLRTDNAAIKARLERLESLVCNGGSPASDAPAELNTRPAKTRRLLEGEALPSPATTVSNANDAEVAKEYRGDFQWLEGVGSQENTRLPQLSTPLPVLVVPLEEIISHALSAPDQSQRTILLPPYEQAKSLMERYIEQLDPVQHLIHCPTVRRDVDELYSHLIQGRSVEPGRTVLLLAMLTSMGSYWGMGGNENPYFTTGSVASKVGMFWLRTAMDVLEHTRRSASASLECVQANIILMFLVYHIEGFSPKVRALHFAALAMAKDLRLHRTDDPSLPVEKSNSSTKNIVDKEMRRRVWWHLAASDWSLSTSGGPHEGTYNVNPRHMRVKRPRNMSDEELETLPEDFDTPLSRPTVMSYYLQRIRLSEICREIADFTWTWDGDPESVSIDDIQRLDAKFDRYFAELPTFLQLDDSAQETAALDRQTPHIRLQSYIVNLIGNARRCKFHLPFLQRASVDNTYAFSRQACLRAARTLIYIRDGLMEADAAMWISNTRLCGLVHISFYGTVVLVMDLICNRGTDCEVQRKEEIQTACASLEVSKSKSPAAAMFLDSLLAVLRKHRINIEKARQDGELVNGPVSGDAVGSSTFAPGHGNAFSHSAPLMPETEASFSAIDFDNLNSDELWQSFIDMDATIDPQSWDALMNDIETMSSRRI